MTDKKAILLRIPPDLWGLLNLWARDDLRSLNAQIEFILREAVRKRTNKAPPEPQPDKPIRSDTTESYSPTQNNG
jgi:hypothetical protein